MTIYSGSAQHFSYKKTPEGIEVSEKNKAVLFFQTKPKTVDGKYERAGSTSISLLSGLKNVK